MRLFLGTHRPTWLAQDGLPSLMVSLNTMPKRAPWRAVVPWFVDSAGFTELQGWEEDDYHRCADMYESAGVDLAAARLVGVGSVCRREATPDAVRIIRSIATRGYRLHGFGFKQDGIGACWPWLASADSMAWSYNARNEARKARASGVPRPGGCTRDVSCANHQHYALEWYRRTIAQVTPMQLSIEGAA